jgi:hypothetical protein
MPQIFHALIRIVYMVDDLSLNEKPTRCLSFESIIVAGGLLRKRGKQNAARHV